MTDYERIPVKVREMPERLRYLANHWENNPDEHLSRLGVMLSLRMLADEIEGELIDGQVGS